MGKKTVKKDKFAQREAEKYENPIASREFILEFIENQDHPVTFSHILENLGIQDPEQEEALRRRLKAMIRDGQVVKNRRGAYGLLKKMQLIKGRVTGHKDGFGFVIPESGGSDLFLNARQMRTVFPNDEVLVRVANIDSRGRREAIIVDVLKRNTTELVGRMVNEYGSIRVEPANQRIVQDILIPADATNGAQDGQMVIVEIIEPPTPHNRAIGKIKEVLGDHMAPGMEIDVAIRNHQLPHEWPDTVLKEAKKFPTIVPKEDLKGREDFRDFAFVTIDGEDAKDFDDAVFCKRFRSGWKLYVAIADVSHYVKPDSFLDKEAYVRGTSVYFPAHVLPMLPEVLSNELCSLKPKVDRLTMVCEMTITAKGKISNYRFLEGVICSHARLTYNEVYELIEKKSTKLRKKYITLIDPLEDLYAVYRALHTARIKRGAIDFELPETKVVFGEGRKIERIVPVIRNSAHRLIEECMLCANISAAEYILKNDTTCLYRNHEGPSTEKLNNLRKFLSETGLKLPGREIPTPSDYAKLLLSIIDRPDAHLIQTILLRSLSQAVYGPNNRGHFGLAYGAYTHFTSPIRRYPDLLVHRTIKKILQKKHKPTEVDPAFEAYGEHCSMTERRADDATREVMDWLKCEYMMDKVGEEFPGVITGVTSFGLFVELQDIYVEGLVHISMLGNDYYQFDAVKHALLGERTGKRYRIGDSVHVRVASVNLDKREIDFIFPSALKDSKKDTKQKKKKHKKS